MSAVISSCGAFRYRLEREICLFGSTAAVIMVNPSTADAETDDATIRRVIGFGKRLGWPRIIVGNVFAFRATDIRELASARDPVGPDNPLHLRGILGDADVAVAAWGPLAKLPMNLRNEWRKVAALAAGMDLPLYCFGQAKDGQPRHPLMLSYDAQLACWKMPLREQ